MALLSKKDKNKSPEIFNLKEYNRKKIKEQDTIFIVSAIIIIIALVGFVSFFINFVVTQINNVFQDVSSSTTKIEVFNEKDFNEIKDKLPGAEDFKKQIEELLESETTTLESGISPQLEQTNLESNATTTQENATSTLENTPNTTSSQETLIENSPTPSSNIAPSLMPSS